MLPILRVSKLLLQASFRDSIQQATRLRAPGSSGYQVRKVTSPSTLQARPRNRLTSATTSRCRSGLLQSFRSRVRHNSSSSKPPAQESRPPPSLGLSARFKELSRKYGWAAVGVYFALSAVDFPFCYLAVRWLGTDRIAIAEHFVVKNFWKVVGQLGLDMRQDKHIPAPAAVTAAGMNAGEEMAEQTGTQAGHDSASMCARESCILYVVLMSYQVFGRSCCLRTVCTSH